MANSKLARIVILGGGFAGMYTALQLEKTLARKGDVEVTLVNRDNFFLFTPLLQEVAASDLEITNIVNPIRKMLRHVSVVAAEVESIDLEHHCVNVAHGRKNH